jgi:hypothetical protein
MNLLVAPTEADGFRILSAFGCSRSQWRVLNYFGAATGLKPETLVVVEPVLNYEQSASDSAAEAFAIRQWMEGPVAHLMARSTKAIIIRGKLVT